LSETQQLSIGEHFSGRYVVRARLGAGGMGAVYDVQDILLGESVALKVGLPGNSEADRAYQLALRREVSLARKITHPGVARIYDLGVAEGRFYITMERLVGHSLSSHLSSGPSSIGEATWIGCQIASALAAAHDAGVIHGDLKPSNIMICDGALQRVVLLDFGVAKAMGTRGRGMGTPTYMSPEQVTDAPLTGASDVYALGLVLHRMLTGRVPFQGARSMATLAARVDATPPPLEGDFPAALVELCARMLALSPDQRPTARQLSEALSALSPATRLGPHPESVPGRSRPSDLSNLPASLGPRLAEARQRVLLVGREYGVLELCGEALAVAPDLDLALALRAVVLARIHGRTTHQHEAELPAGESASAIATALQQAPHLPESHLADAVQAMSAGDLGYTVRALRRALHRDPVHLPAHQMLFRIEIEAGVSVAARQELIRSLDPSMLWATPWIARELFFDGRDEEGLALLDEASAHGFEYGAYWTILVRHAIWRGDPDRVRRLRTTMPSSSTFSDCLTHLLSFAAGDTSLGESEAVLAELLALRSSPARVAFLHQLWAELLAPVHPELAAHKVLLAAMQPLADLRWITACPAFHNLRGDPRMERATELVRRRVLHAFSSDELGMLGGGPAVDATSPLHGEADTVRAAVNVPTLPTRKST
jgi:serine/threonine-protein kinase